MMKCLLKCCQVCMNLKPKVSQADFSRYLFLERYLVKSLSSNNSEDIDYDDRRETINTIYP